MLILYSAPKKKTRTAEPAPEDEEEVVIEEEDILDEESEPDDAEVGDEDDEGDESADDAGEETAKSGAPASNLKNAGAVPKAATTVEVEDDDD